MSLGFSLISLALGEKREGGHVGRLDESLLCSRWLALKWIYKHAA